MDIKQFVVFIGLLAVSSLTMAKAKPSLTSVLCSQQFSDIVKAHCYSYRGEAHIPLVVLSTSQIKERPQRNLIVQIPGGPGQGAMTSKHEMEYWVRWLERSVVDADILLYEPRGTAKDAWRCKALDKTFVEVIGKNITIDEELPLMEKALKHCIKNMRNAYKKHNMNSPLMYFSSINQAQDVISLSEALGYTKLHLWGTSYGTRVALLAAKYPQVKTLILDSPYPFAHGQFSQWPWLFERAWSMHAKLFKEINKSSDFERLFNSISQKLARKPLKVSIKNWQTEEVIPVVLTRERFYEWMFSVLYKPTMYKAFYNGLISYEASGKANDDFIFVLEDFISSVLDLNFNTMVYYVTECIDNEEESEADILKAIHAHPRFADYFSKLAKYDVCKSIARVDTKSVQQQNYVNKPALVFTGKFDPVTPSAWGDELVASLSQAQHKQFLDGAHGVLFYRQCDWQFMQEFISTGNHKVEIRCDEDTLWP